MTPFGKSTPACAGAIPIEVSRTPRAGLSDFAIGCRNAPPSTAGFLLIGVGPDRTGTSIGGATLHLSLGLPLFLLPWTTDAAGRARRNRWPEGLLPVRVEQHGGLWRQGQAQRQQRGGADRTVVLAPYAT